jgi:hypothetical protein
MPGTKPIDQSVNQSKMAQFQLSPCTPSDLDAMVEIYLRAFNKTYMYQMLFPISSCTTSSVRTWLYPRFKKVLTQGHAEVKLFKITEAATGRVVAWSRWGYPFSLTDEEKARRDAETAREDKEREEAERAAGKSGKWPEGANEEACREYFGAMDGMRGKYMKWDQDYSSSPPLILLYAISFAYNPSSMLSASHRSRFPTAWLGRYASGARDSTGGGGG